MKAADAADRARRLILSEGRVRGVGSRLGAPCAVTLIALLGGQFVPRANAVPRDTAIYPVSANAGPRVPPPPLGFETRCETALPGLPLPSPIAASEDSRTLLVRTHSGDYVVDRSGQRADSGAANQGRIAAPRNDTEAQAAGCAWRGGKPPRWVSRVSRTERPSWCVDGPDGIVAMMGADGSIIGRDRRHGHVLWRRIATNRLSRPGVRFGDYLLVAADTASTLQALRWSDGSPAGIFKLSSDDAAFTSRPVVLGDLVYVLSVTTPLQETRLICLRPYAIPAPQGAGSPLAPGSR